MKDIDDLDDHVDIVDNYDFDLMDVNFDHDHNVHAHVRDRDHENDHDRVHDHEDVIDLNYFVHVVIDFYPSFVNHEMILVQNNFFLDL